MKIIPFDETQGFWFGIWFLTEFPFDEDVRYNCHLCGNAKLTRHDLEDHVHSVSHRKKFVESRSNSAWLMMTEKLELDEFDY